MQYLNICFFILFVFRITNTNAAIKDTLAILTNNSQKYWNVIGNNNYGICFYINGDYEDFLYRKRLISCNEEEIFRYHTNTCNAMSMSGIEYKVKDGKIGLFYKRNHSDAIKEYIITELSETKLNLFSGNDTLSYCVADNQETPITIEPELQRGYEVATTQDSYNSLYSIIDSVQTICREEGKSWPFSFQVNVLLRIDDDGFICNAEYVKGIIEYFPGLPDESFFYTLLLDKIKQIHFIPARNELKGEKYFSELILPIKYIKPY